MQIDFQNYYAKADSQSMCSKPAIKGLIIPKNVVKYTLCLKKQ